MIQHILLISSYMVIANLPFAIFLARLFISIFRVNLKLEYLKFVINSIWSTRSCMCLAIINMIVVDCSFGVQITEERWHEVPESFSSS